VQRLDEARNTTGLQVRIVIGIVNAMAAGLSAQMPPELGAQSTALKDKIEPVLAVAADRSVHAGAYIKTKVSQPVN
jgi:hypothetical protein